VIAFSALGIVVLIVAYLVFIGGGSSEYKLLFDDAGQLVKGDQVEVGGVPAGSIKNMQLTKNNKALITITVNSSLVPLHQGTTAEIRVPSLSSVADRYITLSLGPNTINGHPNPTLPTGATLPTTSTHGVVDIDQLFNAFTPRTRKGLQGFIQGSAEQYAGAEEALNVATGYFAPAINATGHIFAELAREQNALTRFLIQTAGALSVIGAHSQQLTDLVGNADQAFQAVASHQADLTAGLRELPSTFQSGVKTFEEVKPTFSALTRLVNVSKPGTKNLALFLSRLRPLLEQATPVVRNLSLAIDQPGASNDLTDVALEFPGLAKTLATGSPDTVKSLEESVPITAMFGPYSPDLQGLFRDFGQSTAYYDANGHYVHVTPVFDSFKLNEKNELTPASPQEGLQGLKSFQLRRCPGSATQPPADGSAPFTDEGKLNCDPTQTP
jgi:phospholipid/cholesterol/gamma-HCH transport system substrate-binding protein